MSVIQDLLRNIPLPKMATIKQTFDNTKLEDIDERVHQECQKPDIMGKIKPDARIAIAVGSRGIANIAQITAAVVQEIKKAGGKPFIVPSMGSHGGATGAGQQDVLARLGVTEDSVKAPIVSSMEVVEVGRLENNLPIYVDKQAVEADGIVVVNRIKPHTAFRGTVESGLMKMISIGLGKQKGAEACHQLGFRYMAEHVPAMAKIAMAKLPILFGVGIVENAYDQTYSVTAVPAEKIEEVEPKLLLKAKSLMPRILFDQMDVLVIQEIGKNISGDGMDPNITGRYPTPYASGGPEVNKMVVLDLTPETHGNANGVGAADITTQRLVDKMDRQATYANALTSTVMTPTKIATTMDNDEEALKAAVKTCNILDFSQVRLVFIKNTLELGEIYISESMLDEAENNGGIEIVSQPQPLSFDKDHNLHSMW